MTTYEAVYRDACVNRPDALDFLTAWNLYCHQIDDLIDGREKCPSKFLDALALANIIYSTDFYQANAAHLSMTVMLITNAFADSVAWEKETGWKRAWSDTLRFAGNDMVVAVAVICGGFENARKVSQALREDSWATHHKDGQPI